MARKTALLVIDVQESFRQRDYFKPEFLFPYIERQQALIDGAKAAGIPVIQVFHMDESGPFSLASGHVRTLEPLAVVPDTVVHKRRHSALIGSGLDIWLVKNGINRLIVSGIRTEQCCETTTRHASDLGYEVDFVSEATLTFPMSDASGRIWGVDDITSRTELVLAGRFARIATVEQALEKAIVNTGEPVPA